MVDFMKILKMSEFCKGRIEDGKDIGVIIEPQGVSNPIKETDVFYLDESLMVSFQLLSYAIIY